MLPVAVAVHQHDRDGAVAGVEGALQVRAGGLLVERHDDLAMRADALVCLDHLCVEKLGQDDVPVEEAGAILVRDAQRVAETAGHHHHGALALALQQGVGRDRRAHFHGRQAFRRDVLPGRHAKEMADAGDGGIPVLLGVLRQQLVREQRAVRALRHDIRERAAAIDPEFPRRRRAGGGHGAVRTIAGPCMLCAAPRAV